METSRLTWASTSKIGLNFNDDQSIRLICYKSWDNRKYLPRKEQSISSTRNFPIDVAFHRLSHSILTVGISLRSLQSLPTLDKKVFAL